MGLVLVAGSVLGGATVLAQADDTVTVWAARADLAPGTTIGADDLVPAEVRFGDAGLAERYLPEDELPTGSVLLQSVTSGEMVPRSAVGSEDRTDLAELPVAVPAEAVPAGLRQGQVVDVWVTPPRDGAADVRAVRVLEEVPVVAVPPSSTALGPAGTRQVVVGVAAGDDAAVSRALGALAEGTAVLVRR